MFLTRRGTRIDFAPYFAGSFLGGDTDIYGFDLTASQYFHFPLDTILLLNGEVGSVDTLSGGDRVPVYDRLYLGGPSNLRGFGFRKVGPLDYKGNPVGGRTLVRYTVEFTYPIIARVRGAIFTDGGFVNQDSFNFSPETLSAAAISAPIPTVSTAIPGRPTPTKVARTWTTRNSAAASTPTSASVSVWTCPSARCGSTTAIRSPATELNIRHSGKFNFNVGYQF